MYRMRNIASNSGKNIWKDTLFSNTFLPSNKKELAIFIPKDMGPFQ